VTHNHEEEVPAAIESVVARLGDLETVLGPAVGPVVAAVRTGLIAAMAARDRGDMPAAIGQIGEAMDRLSALADGLDPGEATLMRALARNFRAALLRGDAMQAKQSAATMLERSGGIARQKP
jgi:hypothetical protein